MKKLTILQINDTHSYLELHHEHFYGPDGIEIKKTGGYARLKYLVESIRQEEENVLLFDNGDTLHGTYDAVQSKGWNMVPILREMAFDAMTFHWDSAYTPENLKAISESVGYPVLAMNCYDKESGELFFEPYKIQDIGGIKVAILGLAANFIDKMMPEPFHRGVRFTMGDEELPGVIEEVKAKGAELIILLSHNGFPQDLKMLREIKGIDLCLSSHTHNRLHEPVQVGKTVLIQSGSHGSFLGRIDLEFDGEIQSLKHELITVEADLPEEAAMKELVEAALEENREFLRQEVGCTKELLHRATALHASMDDLLLESMLHASGAQIAFSNGWRYGAPIPPGPMTMEDLYRIIPVNPPLSLTQMTGREIKQMLEENLEATYSCDPYEQKGGYVKRMRGIKIYVKIENPCMLRVQDILVDQDPLQMDKHYSVVYVTKQAVPLERYGSDHQNMDIRAVDALRSYLKEGCYQSDNKPSVIVI